MTGTRHRHSTRHRLIRWAFWLLAALVVGTLLFPAVVPKEVGLTALLLLLSTATVSYGYAAWKEWRLRLFGSWAEGQILSVRRSIGRYGPVYRGRVGFRTKNGETGYADGYLDPGAQVGEPCRVLYDPRHPERATLPEGWFMLLFSTSVVIVLTTVVVILLAQA